MAMRDLMRVPQMAQDDSGDEVTDLAHVVQKANRKKVAGIFGVLAFASVAIFGMGASGLAHMDVTNFLGLSTSHCSDFPRIKLRSTIRSNLGKKGPDRHKEEGILYVGSDWNSAHSNQIHLHVNVEGKDSHGNYIYDAAYPQDNGIYGQFGDINLRGGNNATLKFKITDVDGKPITIPEFDISFFDIDIGTRGGQNTTEAITIYKGWNYVYTSSETQLRTIVNPNGDDPDAVMYKATMLGRSRDSPSDPEVLTAWQYNKAITVRYDQFSEAKITLHAFGPGRSGRYFNFILEPTIKCVDAGVEPETTEPEPEPTTTLPRVESAEVHDVHTAEIVDDADEDKDEDKDEDEDKEKKPKCCLIRAGPVNFLCTDKEQKKFYHFMCDKTPDGAAPAPSPDAEEEEEEGQCCVVQAGPVKLGCVKKSDKKWYHFMCSK